MTAELPATTHVGRVALRVADLPRCADWYAGAVGLAVMERADDRVVLGAGGNPFLALIAAPGAPERGAREAGLFHVAFRVPSRAALGAAMARLEDRRPLTGASDHLVSEAIYARDPEGNGIEVYRDRPRSEWTRRSNGRVTIDTLPLDRDAIRTAEREADPADEAAGVDTDRVPSGTDVGHVHLEPTALDPAVDFYTDVVGLRVRETAGDRAAFLAAGDYHHHLGLNVWGNRTEPAGEGLGLAWYELVVPEGTLPAIRERVDDAGGSTRPVDPAGGSRDAGSSRGFETDDPDSIRVRFSSDDER